MKFSLNHIVAAVGLIAASTPAVAAGSSVQLYGRIDTAIESVKAGAQRIHGVNNSDSYFGLKGQENLGNGMTVGFQLESAFNADDGASTDDEFFGKHSELYLSGSFGTVRMGRFSNPSSDTIADRTSLHNGDYGITYDQLYQSIGNTANRIAYASPDMNGLTLESSVSLHERANGNRTDKNAYDLAANYDRGNWSFGAGYGEHGDEKQYALRATWSQDAWTVSGYHQRAEEIDNGAKAKTNVTRLAVAYAIGAGEVHANFGHANGPQAESANQWTVGYNHHLSKRTKVYAFYSQIQNKNGAEFGDAGMADQDQKSVSVGISHHF